MPQPGMELEAALTARMQGSSQPPAPIVPPPGAGTAARVLLLLWHQIMCFFRKATTKHRMGHEIQHFTGHVQCPSASARLCCWCGCSTQKSCLFHENFREAGAGTTWSCFSFLKHFQTEKSETSTVRN